MLNELDLRNVTPDLLETLKESIWPVLMDENPPEGWDMFFKTVKDAPGFKDMVHKMAHTVMECPSCGVATIGVLMAVLVGFKLAQAMNESGQLTKQFGMLTN
jgi:hypothetical protein